MSEEQDHHTVPERALEVFVYAPVGLLFSVIEEFPDLAEKGRDRLESQINNARVLGQFVVTMGRSEITRRLSRIGAPTRPSPVEEFEAPHAPSPDHERRHVRNAAEGDVVPIVLANGVGLAGALHREPPPNFAIPDYDTLSASQVVRRLEGLTPDELDSIRHYESAGRRRRTILHRAEQLLHPDSAGGTSGPATL